MLPIPAEWWFRPASSACRVGAHSAVVWKRLNFRPSPASRSAVGVSHGPPNALDAPNPTSSRRTIRTFGAPSGGRSGSIGGKVAAGSLASKGRDPSNVRSGTGGASGAIPFVPVANATDFRVASPPAAWRQDRPWSAHLRRPVRPANHVRVRHRADDRAHLRLHVRLDGRLRRAAALLAPDERDLGARLRVLRIDDREREHLPLVRAVADPPREPDR